MDINIFSDCICVGCRHEEGVCISCKKIIMYEAIKDGIDRALSNFSADICIAFQEGAKEGVYNALPLHSDLILAIREAHYGAIRDNESIS